MKMPCIYRRRECERVRAIHLLPDMSNYREVWQFMDMEWDDELPTLLDMPNGDLVGPDVWIVETAECEFIWMNKLDFEKKYAFYRY